MIKQAIESSYYLIPATLIGSLTVGVKPAVIGASITCITNDLVKQMQIEKILTENLSLTEHRADLLITTAQRIASLLFTLQINSTLLHTGPFPPNAEYIALYFTIAAPALIGDVLKKNYNLTQKIYDYFFLA